MKIKNYKTTHFTDVVFEIAEESFSVRFFYDNFGHYVKFEMVNGRRLSAKEFDTLREMVDSCRECE